MPKIKYGAVNIKREFEIDQYLYVVKYTLKTSWDRELCEWLTDDLTIEWIQKTDDNFEKPIRDRVISRKHI